jgi:hypothetical protein
MHAFSLTGGADHEESLAAVVAAIGFEDDGNALEEGTVSAAGFGGPAVRTAWSSKHSSSRKSSEYWFRFRLVR